MNDTIKLINSSVLQHIDKSNVTEPYVVNRFSYSKQHSKVSYSKTAPIFEDINSRVETLPFDDKQNLTMLHYDNSLIKKYPLQSDQIFIENGVNIIEKTCREMTFELSFLMAKIAFSNYFEKISSPSSILEKIKDNIDNNINFSSWEDIANYDTNLFWVLLDLLVHSCDNLRCALSLSSDFKNTKSRVLLYSCKKLFDKNALLNLWQLLKESNEIINESDILKDLKITSISSEIDLNFFLYYEKDSSKKVKGLINTTSLVEIFSELHEKLIIQKHFRILFHQNTFNFLKERKHAILENRFSVLINTFYWWMITNIKPIDRYRYLLAGSCIKSAYNFRDANDVDFFVLDHHDDIEKYSKYFPNIGIEGYFEDFGKTYYANEEYYFPMIPSMFEKNKEFKKNQREKTKLLTPLEKTINNNYPKYSVSGLKVARYIVHFMDLLKNFNFSEGINNLDDFILSNETKIYFLGVPLVDLRFEICRDHIKDIDLERVSLKQCHDFHYCLMNYPNIFTNEQIRNLGLEKYKSSFTRNWKEPLLKLTVNLYHKPYESEEKIGYGILILHCPIYFNDCLKKFIKNAPLLEYIQDDLTLNDLHKTVYRNILISSLPSEIKIGDTEHSGVYQYELLPDGIFDINFIYNENEVKLNEKVIATGIFKVSLSNNSKKIGFSVDNRYSNKEYYLTIINFIKNCINFHKIIDSHTREKIILEYIK